jgi:glycosyltransferase involved in cell wall biosynthesis
MSNPASKTDPAASEPDRPVAVIAWTWIQGRSAELAEALGAESLRYFWPPFTALPLVPVRYLVSALRTAAFILTKRPRGLVVQNPPLVAPLVALGPARLVGARLVVDAHTGAFARTGLRRWVPDRVNNWLAGRVAAVMVTAEPIAERVRRSGGLPIILHEAPPQGLTSDPPPQEERLRVLVVNRFAPDEPVSEVVEATRELTEMEFTITGSERLRPPGLAERAGRNVVFPGFLSLDDYRRTLANSHIVVSLSTRLTSVSRAAYDAVWARRPLVVSGGPQMAELFPRAIFVENTAASIAAGLRTAAEHYAQLAIETDAALEITRARWEEQAGQLVAALDGDRA